MRTDVIFCSKNIAMDIIIDRLTKNSFCGNDILRILDGKARILSYDQLEGIKSLDELFGEFNSVFILYKTSQNYGHWCLVLRHRNSVEFFDSYGEPCDSQFRHMTIDFKRPHWLSSLILKSGLTVETNVVPLQDDETATCARHCTLRAIMKNLKINEYCAMMMKFEQKHKLTPDEFVSMMLSVM
jgi:hypothetical protein